MRKALLLISCIVTLSAEQMYLYEISPIIGLSENGTSTGLKRSDAYGLEFQYNDIDFPIKPELTYIYEPSVQLHTLNPSSPVSLDAHLLMLNAVYDLEYTAILTPFLKAGIGYQRLSKDIETLERNAFVVGAGAGLKLHVHDNIAIKFEAMMTHQNFEHTNILVFGGLNFAFGNEDNSAVKSIPLLRIVHDVNETNNTQKVQEFTLAETIYISKADHNLTKSIPSKQEIVLRDEQQNLSSLTLFVSYLFRGYTLDEDSKTILIKYAKELRQQNSHITIVGHTDSKGRRAFNQELSLKRANTVKELFVEFNVAAERITVEGRGESDPIADKNTPGASELNKRIEIIIKKQTQGQEKE